MIESIIYNVAVMVAGIYLFHQLQYSENKIMVFSKGYVTVLMTIVALLLAAYQFHSIKVFSSFNICPIVIFRTLY